jgi:hypothetical protein
MRLPAKALFLADDYNDAMRAKCPRVAAKFGRQILPFITAKHCEECEAYAGGECRLCHEQMNKSDECFFLRFDSRRQKR